MLSSYFPSYNQEYSGREGADQASSVTQQRPAAGIDEISLWNIE
jgi:hypothetical protein